MMEEQGKGTAELGDVMARTRKEQAELVVLRRVAGAAQAVRAGASPRPEYEGLVKVIIHVQDWHALTDALDALEALLAAGTGGG